MRMDRRLPGKHRAQPRLQAVHVDVHDRRRKEREHLAEDEAADDGNSKWAAKFGSDTRAECERHGAQKGRHGGH